MKNGRLAEIEAFAAGREEHARHYHDGHDPCDGWEELAAEQIQELSAAVRHYRDAVSMAAYLLSVSKGDGDAADVGRMLNEALAGPPPGP